MDLEKYNQQAFPAMPIYFDDPNTRQNFEQALQAALNPSAHTPASNIIITKDGYLLELVAPGMQKDQFEISLEGNVLEITTKHHGPQAKEAGSQAFIQREYFHQGFSRKFNIPVDEINPKNIDASYEEGILRIKLPFKAGFQGPETLRINVR